MNFGELIDRVRRYRGIDSGSEETDSGTYIKQTVNSVYREVLSQEDFPWLVKEVTIQTTPSFTDGVLIATNGLNVMTLTGTSTYTGFDHRYWGGKLKVTGEDMYYEVIETSRHEANPYYVYLDRPFAGTTTSELSFVLYRDAYPLPYDFKKIEGRPRFAGSSSYELVPRQPVKFDHLHPQVLRTAPGGDPTEYSIWRRRDGAWFTSTATFTNGVNTVRLEGNGSYFGIENWRYRVVEDGGGTRYRVLRGGNTNTVDNVLLELDRPYAGASGSNTVVKVDPRGGFLFQVWDPPTTVQKFILKYQSDDPDMVNNADEPVIPEDYHDVIWKGSIYYISQYDDSVPPEATVLLKRDYDEARIRLESYRSLDRASSIQRKMYGASHSGFGFQMPDYIDA